MPRRWYHVLVETDKPMLKASRDKRYLIAIEASSALEARKLVASDFGKSSVLSVKVSR